MEKSKCPFRGESLNAPSEDKEAHGASAREDADTMITILALVEI